VLREPLDEPIDAIDHVHRNAEDHELEVPGSPFCSRYPRPVPGVARRGQCRFPMGRSTNGGRTYGRTYRRSRGRRSFSLGTRRQDTPAGRALAVRCKLRRVPELAAVVTPRQVRRSPWSPGYAQVDGARRAAEGRARSVGRARPSTYALAPSPETSPMPRAEPPALTMREPRPPTSYARADRTALAATKAPAAPSPGRRYRCYGCCRSGARGVCPHTRQPGLAGGSTARGPHEPRAGRNCSSGDGAALRRRTFLRASGQGGPHTHRCHGCDTRWRRVLAGRR